MPLPQRRQGQLAFKESALSKSLSDLSELHGNVETSSSQWVLSAKRDSSLKDGRCWSYEGENELGLMTDGISGSVTSTSSSACTEFTCCPCHGQRELCANADVDGVADIVYVDDVDVVDQVDIAENVSTALSRSTRTLCKCWFWYFGYCIQSTRHHG